MRYRYALILLLFACYAGSSIPARAETLLIAARGSLLTTGRALIKVSQPKSDTSSVQPSLFTGKSGSSLFAPLPPRIPRNLAVRGSSQVERLRALIGQAESVMLGYNAVQHGAKKRPSKLPTEMTLGEIFDWIDATPGQPHAIGRYQFIPKTLRRLVKRLGVQRDYVFTPRLQDQLSDILLSEAGLEDFNAGAITRHAFMYNLSKIWAGLPTSNGQSYYHGFAGNKASITWTHFDTEMASIFG